MDATVEEVDAVLAHFGVKGMKWGVRKDRGHEGERVRVGKLARLDKKFDRQNDFFKLNNAVADKMNGPKGLYSKLNSKAEYKGKNLQDPKNKALYRKYLREANDTLTKGYRAVAKDIGVNPSGTRKLAVELHPLSREASFRFADIKHADDFEDIVEFIGALDSNGFIISIKKLDANGDTLAHFGVKGMKWGQRLADRKARKAETSGEAKTSIDVRTKAKTHSVKALTNAELVTALNRMNLEQSFKKAANNERSGVSRFLSATLSDIGKREFQSMLAKKVTGAIAKAAVTGTP